MLDDIELSRRAIFVLSRTEQKLGLSSREIPIKSRLENVLTSAMHSPLAIEACEYRILHLMFTELGKPLPAVSASERV